MVGIGGIATIDDVMEFLVAGATAVQIGTANFYDPTVSQRLVEQLPAGAGRGGRAASRRTWSGRCSCPQLLGRRTYRLPGTAKLAWMILVLITSH